METAAKANSKGETIADRIDSDRDRVMVLYLTWIV